MSPQTNAEYRNAPPVEAGAIPASMDQVSLLQKFDTTLDEMCSTIRQLDTALSAATQPPERHRVPLTNTKWFFSHTSSRTSLSFTVYNPGNVAVFLSIDGGNPSRAGGALEIPAGALVTYPAPGDNIQLAIDPADLSSVDATGFSVDVLRHWTVQPAARYLLNVGIDGGGA